MSTKPRPGRVSDPSEGDQTLPPSTGGNRRGSGPRRDHRAKRPKDANSIASCDAAQAGPQTYELDAGGKVAPGLRLRVTPGGAKSWTLRYRVGKGGPRRRMAIGGSYPATTLAEARTLALEELAKIGRGIDPQTAAAAERDAMCMVDLFGDDKAPGWYLATYVATAGKIATAKSAKGIANDRYAIAKHLRNRKALMAKRVDAVTTGDLNAIKVAATPSTWRKLRNILLVAFEHAEEVGALAPGTNPVTRTSAATDKKRDHFLAPSERARLDATLARAAELGPSMPGGMSRHLVVAVRLLALTGLRRGDVLALRWEHVDWRHSVARLPIGKTGARDVPLSPQALAFLKAERGAAARIGLVVATPEGGPVHPENIGRAWQTLRKAAKLDKVRLHDLRHSWASDAVSAGVPLYVVGAALGHRQPSTTARYAHLHDKAIREGLAAAGDAIERATKGGES